MPTATTMTIPAKLDAMEDHINSVIFERRPVIRTAVTSLIAMTHHIQYGPPGTAKSMIVDEMQKLIYDFVYFRWLMTPTTAPEEVFGPFSIQGMKRDEFIRHLAGKLVPANVGFLDEFFNANSPIINALLTMMNEGLYFNGADTIISRPLIFTGTNSLPRGTDLAASWDRFDFRHVIDGLKETGNKERMLRAGLLRIQGKIVQPDPIITWAEIQQAQIARCLVEFTDEVFEALLKLWAALKKKGIEPTDRRYYKCLAVIQATAYRAGRGIADVDDMRDLRHMLWVEPSQIGIVEDEVFALANPLDKEAMDLVKLVDKLAAEVEEVLRTTDNEQQRQKKAYEINGKLDKVSDDLDILHAKVVASQRRTDMVTEAQRRLAQVLADLLWRCFDIKDDSKPAKP